MPRPTVSPPDRALAQRFDTCLQDYAEAVRALPGITSPEVRDVFVAQLIDSDRRRRYARRVASSNPDPKVLGEPLSAFHPLFGAIRCARDGDLDEACWLVFLATHFGFHRRKGWALSANFYRCLNSGKLWTWSAVCADPGAVRGWLDNNREVLRSTGGPFGNHHKYESLAGSTSRGTGETIETYIRWVGTSHRVHFDDLCLAGSARESFAAAYTSMADVARFGRTARFDYLTMLGKLGLIGLCPDKLYLQNATGPLEGAQLLFSGSKSAKTPARELENYSQELGDALEITYDILEDGLCNWQKSPSRFTSFRG